MKVTELSKVLGQKWKELGDEEKAKYEAIAAEDKKRYASEKATFDQANPSPSPKRKKSKAAVEAESEEDDSDAMELSEDSADSE